LGNKEENMREFKIKRPWDMHLHLREGEMLKNVLPFTNTVFDRAVVMGNLASGPVKNAADMERYRREIIKNSDDNDFEPIMSVMLVKSSTPEMIREAARAGARVLKWIPGGTSTNSDAGVSPYELRWYYPVLIEARDRGMIFSCHMELAVDENGNEIPELNRESMAIPILDRLITDMPGLQIVVEHATTCDMIMYLRNAPKNVGATLTVHGAILTLDDVCDTYGRIIKNPDLYCKPIAKTIYDRKMVIDTMVSGDPRFFFGSDSAPHPIEKKQAIPPAAGIYTAPVALPLLCTLFEKYGEDGWVKKMGNFTSVFGPRFYGFAPSEKQILMLRQEWIVPEQYKGVRIFKGRERLQWKFSGKC